MNQHQPQRHPSRHIDRRRLLRLVGASAFGALAVPLLAACEEYDENTGEDGEDTGIGVIEGGPGVTVTPPSFTPISSATPIGTQAATPTAATTLTGPSFTVNMTDQLKFEPERITIPRGGTITWRNIGTIVHTATADRSKAQRQSSVRLPSGVQPWDSGLLTGGQSWSRTFDVPGEYTYFCIPHELQGMIGFITVQD